MFRKHISHQMAAQLDDEQVKRGMAMMEHLRLVEAPESIWTSIETALDENRLRPAAGMWRWGWAGAAMVALVLAVAGYRLFEHNFGTRWEVARVEGSLAASAKRSVGPGEWIETDAQSRVMVKVGKIGSVEVAPNTRMRIVTARPDEHRIALLRGELYAQISAPPKLFFVDTAAGTAVDLGCEYTLHSDEKGFGWLRVSRGWVSFQWKGVESLVPAGASCRTRPQAGPGIPCFDDAPDGVKQALEIYGVERPGSDVLSTILSNSRVRDTLALWHLLWRVEGADRERVFERMAALTPLPSGVSRDLALRLDPVTLQRWREELAWTW